MDSDTALGNLIHDRIFGSDEQKQKDKDRRRNDASEAQTLRKFLALQSPGRKDEFTSQSLPDLRGELMAFTDSQRQAQTSNRERLAAQNEMSATALQDLLAEFNQPGPEVDSPSAPGLFPQLQTPAPRFNSANMRAALPRHPGAVNAANLPELMRVLQAGDAGEEDGGAPQILPGPFPNTRIVTDKRGRSTPQVVREEKSAEGYIEVPDATDPAFGPKIRLPLSQAQKDYPHLLNRLKPSYAPGSTSPYQSAEEVKAAVKAGTLKKDEALKILREQFKMK